MDVATIQTAQLPLLVRLTRSYVEAEDTLQAGLLIVIQQWPDKPDAEINRMLRTCCRRLYLNRLRNDRRRKRREGEASALKGSAVVDNEIRHERMSVLQNAVDTLPSAFAEIVQ